MGIKGGASVLIVDGVEWEIDPESAKYDVRSSMLESVVTGRGKAGVTEKGMAPFIEVKAFRDDSQDWSTLSGDKQTVILRTAGRDVTLSNGVHLIGELSEDAKDSGATLRFEGGSGKAVGG